MGRRSLLCNACYCSEYPLDSLDVPAAPEQQRLNSWQETHARFMLQRVQQLQDLRFVLCPKYVPGHGAVCVVLLEQPSGAAAGGSHHGLWCRGCGWQLPDMVSWTVAAGQDCLLV